MGQKRRILNPIGIFIATCTIIFTIPSCIDELYDLKNGISSEMVLGGDSLAMPLGTTDSIKLSDFLSTDDVEMLKTMENGGYGLTMKDSMRVDVPKIDQTTLKIDDQTFNQKQSVSFGEISLQDFEIPAFTKTDTLDLSMGAISLDDFEIPPIASNQNYSTEMYDYKLDPTKLAIGDTTVFGGTDNMLSNITLPPNPGIEVEVPLPNPPNPANVNYSNTLNYNISVPDGISGVDTIDLIDTPNDGTFEITIELVNANGVLTAGTITPNLILNPSDLFIFHEPQPTGIHFGASEALNKANGYKFTKTLDIDAFLIKDYQINGENLSFTKNISVSNGTMTSTGLKVMASDLNNVQNLDLKVSVKIDNLVIESMSFDIPTIQTDIDGSTKFTMSNNIPKDIKKVNKVIFDNGGTISFDLGMLNLPKMIRRTINIDQLAITFPNKFVFAPNQTGLSGQTYTLPNSEKVFNPVQGKNIKLYLKELNTSIIDLDTENDLYWPDSVTFSGRFSFSGRINSKNIPNEDNDTKMKMDVTSDLGFNSAEVTTNDISKPLPTSEVPVKLDVDIANQVDSLNVVNVTPGTKFRLNLVKPTDLPQSLPFKGKDIRIVFPPLFRFNPPLPLLNTYVIPDGAIPDFIELELAALNINEKLNTGKLSLSKNVTISGDVTLESGVVNSLDIKNLNASKMLVTAQMPALKIASTTVKLKSLVADFSDSTKLEIEESNIPSEIISLDSILLQNNATLQLSVSLTNMPAMSSPLMANLTLDFPKLLRFAPGAVNASNQLVINEPFVNGKLTKTLSIKGLHFNGSELNRKLTINEKVKFDGQVSVNNPSVNSTDLNSNPIDINVDVKLAGIKFKSVYGKVNPGIEPQTAHVTLGDLPDFMKKEDVVLDITKPVISLETRSNLGIPIKAGMDLTPMRNNAEITDGKLKVDLDFPRSSTASMDRITRFWIAPDSAGMPDDYIFIKTDIQNLFKKIPDEINFIVDAQADPTQQHFIDLTSDYRMKVNYDVTVPMAFGSELAIEICDTISDLDESIGEIALSGKKLELFGTIFNSIPLDLTIILTPLDGQNKKINVTPASQKINSGKRDGGATATPLAIKLDDPNGLLKDVRGFEMKFKASSNGTVAGIPIRPENFVKADLKVRLNGGLKVGGK